MSKIIFNILLFLLLVNNVVGQKNSLKNQKVGFLLGALTTVNYFGIGSVEEQEENSFLAVSNKLDINLECC